MFTVDHLLRDYWPEFNASAWQKRFLRRVMREQEFIRFAAEYPHLHGLEMVEQMLEYLDVRCELTARELEQIPVSGPLVLVANHPLGALDGLALLHAVAQVRRDVKIVANRLLMSLTCLHPVLLPVDNMGQKTGREQLSGIRQQLANQGVVIIFPAGEVSRLSSKGIKDGRWHHSFVRLAAKSRAPVLPVFVAGKNSLPFYLTAKLCPPAALLMLVREMFRCRGTTVKMQVGARIPFSNWYDGHTPAKELASRLRKHLYRIARGRPGLFQTENAIARPEDRVAVRKQLFSSELLGRLPDGKYIFLWQRGKESYVPVLREIGRLREIAFRAVGEGSGRRRDLDRYDDDYFHLVLWDDETLEIVGAYRLLPTASQLTDAETRGIYSQSLFEYDPGMLPVLSQGIELGRSFVQPAYWGSRGLEYLWMGIGAFLARYPHIRYLFGPVSISGGLPLAARDLLVAFYRLYFPPAAELATSRRPYPASLPEVLAQFSGDDYQQDLRCLKRLLANMGCAIPPLYKQYSELCEPGGVQFIDFGSDPDFNNCVDGLVLVDLSLIKPLRYQRYVGVFTRQDAMNTQPKETVSDTAE
ncbi:lysophospholipid acyltransferase family protein [Tatumella sp. UBA2305]|uniref:lysophospholipid acyltransferase family protein n=1 Tax=Tatumella sp. UBA2305 TaxID=1947647 RepID=UPI0025F42163|nr:GNAT family N-acyltransferase [Tatumella sp. UBA2305]